MGPTNISTCASERVMLQLMPAAVSSNRALMMLIHALEKQVYIAIFYPLVFNLLIFVLSGLRIRAFFDGRIRMQIFS